ncbi:MAG: protein-disulfide reductase DsbD domain-containing protein, partial [Pseudomonadota bacterium]
MVFFRGLLFALLLVLVGVFATPASAQPVDGGHARVELISERALAVPGETVWLGLSFEIDPNWHIYWINPGDAGIPPEITWKETSHPASQTAGAFEWPLPELLPVVPGQIMDYGYSDQVVLPFRIQIPDNADGPLLFEGVADYLICEDVCIPESADIRLLLSVGAAQLPDTYGSERIQAALMQVPPEFTGDASISRTGDAWTLSLAGEQVAGQIGDARFFPYGHEITHAADQLASFGENGARLRLQPAQDDAPAPDTLAGVVTIGDLALQVSATSGAVLPGTTGAAGTGGGVGIPGGGNLLFLMGFALVGGLILNLMPCVLPVLSIKAMGIVASTANGNAAEARAHGLWYAAGVLVSFAALAVAILAVRAIGSGGDDTHGLDREHRQDAWHQV